MVFASKQTPDPPQLALEILKDGKVVDQVPLRLGAPGGTGRIPFFAALPVEGFEPGRYEVIAVALQGSATAQERTSFTVIRWEAVAVRPPACMKADSLWSGLQKAGGLTEISRVARVSFRLFEFEGHCFASRSKSV